MPLHFKTWTCIHIHRHASDTLDSGRINAKLVKAIRFGRNQVKSSHKSIKVICIRTIQFPGLPLSHANAVQAAVAFVHVGSIVTHRHYTPKLDKLSSKSCATSTIFWPLAITEDISVSTEYNRKSQMQKEGQAMTTKKAKDRRQA